VQYHFVTVERFKDEVAEGSFVEWAVYSGNYYGTSLRAIHDLKSKNQIALLDIDLQGVKTLKLPFCFFNLSVFACFCFI